MKAVTYRLFWNSETLHWTLVRNVEDVEGCEATLLAEHAETATYRQWLAPKEWAADIIGCQEDDFRGTVDEYYGRPMTWTVTAVMATN